MNLVFVHPEAGLVVLAVVAPLAATAVARRRAARVRTTLGLSAPPQRSSRLALGAIVGLASLTAAAAAQPVLLDRKPVALREDAEAYIVVDITRSMLASGSRDSPTRLERALRAASRIRAAVPDVQVGLASFTNRVVPHVFPTVDGAVFGSGLRRSIAIESPPPDRGEGAVLTAFDALAPLQTHNFFARRSQRRVAVVITDGETSPVARETIEALRSPPRLELVIVRTWEEGERIFGSRRVEDAGYRADPASSQVLGSFVVATGARLFAESDVGQAAGMTRRLLGRGEPVRTGTEVSARPLAGWTFALAFVPLGYLLWRRNLV